MKIEPFDRINFDSKTLWKSYVPMLWWTLVLALTIGCVSSFAQTNLNCGSLANHYGPYDYRTDRGKLPIVDSAHFTPEVEALIRGHTSSRGPGGDINYTLTAFPNHHRALLAVLRYGEKMRPAQPRDLPLSVECYFERAVRFRPDDAIARMIYATFLSKNSRDPEATQQLELANALAEDNAFTHYNIGLIYFDMKNYAQAQAQAQKAYSLGSLSPELRDQLKSAGKWIEPPGTPAGTGEKP
jgi:hypothetical protein